MTWKVCCLDSPFRTEGPILPAAGMLLTNVKWKLLSRVSLWPRGLYSPWNSPGHNTGVTSLSLLQGIFPTQGLNPGLLHCRQILCQADASPQGKPCLIQNNRDFLGMPVGEGSSSSAGNEGSVPGWRTKSSHATGQLSPCAATKDPACCNKTPCSQINILFFFQINI